METTILSFWAILLLSIIIYEVNRRRRKALIAERWEVYKNALNSGNKQEALYAGRAYYAELRNGELTIYDEQAIANDLSTIK
ncbi:MAG TPA: hypothetical protein VF610_00370 [Segetibacter sp.]